MSFDELTRSTGEWLRGVGRMSDVVISSRIRLARNLAEHAFLSTARATERTEIYRQIVEEITASTMAQETVVFDVDDLDAGKSLRFEFAPMTVGSTTSNALPYGIGIAGLALIVVILAFGLRRPAGE